MLSRVVMALIVGVITAIVVYIVGAILVPVTPAIGGFLESISYLVGVLAALWYFFAYNRTNPVI